MHQCVQYITYCILSRIYAVVSLLNNSPECVVRCNNVLGPRSQIKLIMVIIILMKIILVIIIKIKIIITIMIIVEIMIDNGDGGD